MTSKIFPRRKMSAEWAAIDALWDAWEGKEAPQEEKAVTEPELAPKSDFAEFWAATAHMKPAQRRAAAVARIHRKAEINLENQIDDLRRTHYELLNDIYGPNPKFVRV